MSDDKEGKRGITGSQAGCRAEECIPPRGDDSFWSSYSGDRETAQRLIHFWQKSLLVVVIKRPEVSTYVREAEKAKTSLPLST